MEDTSSSIPWKGIDPKVRLTWVVGGILYPFLLFLMPIIILALRGKKLMPQSAIPPVLYPIFGWIAVTLIVLAMVNARWKSWQYRLTANDLAVRYGVLTRMRKYVARHRIQHVDLHSGVIDKMLGLASVNVYVASGSAINIPGLSELDAENMRQVLLRPDPIAPEPPKLEPPVPGIGF